MSDEVDAKNEELIRAYRQTFNTPAGQIVFLDLMKFCKFRVPIDDRLDEGKRQAFLRIESFLALTPEQLHSLYRGQGTVMTATEEPDDE